MAWAALKSEGLALVRRAPGGAVIAFFVMSGLFKLVPVVFSDVLPLDSDEAVLGLMARHIARGGFPRFFYGQTYGGGFEVLLAAGLERLLPSGIFVFRLAAALLAFATECLLYRALAASFSSRATRIAATAMLALGGMTYPRFVSHLYGVHLNNIFIFASLLWCFSDVRAFPRRTFFLGLCIGVGYWVSPYVWVLVACILAARPRQWREWRSLTLGQLLLGVVGFATGAFPRILHSYSPEGWYAPYGGGGFALARAAAIPERSLEVALGTFPQYFFGGLPSLGMAGTIAMVIAAGLFVAILVLAVVPTFRDWRQGQRSAWLPVSIFLFAGASALLVVLNRRVFDSGSRYLLSMQFAMAVAWATLIERMETIEQRQSPQTRQRAANRVLRALGFSCLAVPFLLGALSLFLAQREDARSHATALKATIAAQALSSGCRVGVADYWYAYSLSLLTQEELRLAPIYTPRIPAYAQAAAQAIAAGTRYCAILDLSSQAQSMESNHEVFIKLQSKARSMYRYPGSIVLLILGDLPTGWE